MHPLRFHSVYLALISALALAPLGRADYYRPPSQTDVDNYNRNAAANQKTIDDHNSSNAAFHSGYGDNSSRSDDSYSRHLENLAQQAEEEAARKAEAAKEAALNKAYSAVILSQHEAAQFLVLRDERLAQIKRLRATRANSPAAQAALCRIRLGVEPGFWSGYEDVKPLMVAKDAQAEVASAVIQGNPEVLRALWKIIVTKELNSPNLDVTELNWRRAVHPIAGDCIPAQHDDYAWFEASLCDRILACPQLAELHTKVRRRWQWRVPNLILRHPEYVRHLSLQMGETLPARLLEGHEDDAARYTDAGERMSSCLLAYAAIHDALPATLAETTRSRHAAALAEHSDSPLTVDRVLIKLAPGQRWQALSAGLTANYASSEWLRYALSLMVNDPELQHRRTTDPDLLARDVPLHGVIRGIPILLKELSATAQPFGPEGGNEAVVLLLADRVNRSAQAPKWLAAFIAKAPDSKMIPVRQQLALIQAGAMIRDNRCDLESLRIACESPGPGTRIPCDTLLSFTPAQASACILKSDTPDAVRATLLTFAAFGSAKAAAALAAAPADPVLNRPAPTK